MGAVRSHCVLFKSRRLIYLSLACLTGSPTPTAQRLCLPRREFVVAAENMTLESTRRFPNPVPSGIRVPQWAVINVTVSC